MNVLPVAILINLIHNFGMFMSIKPGAFSISLSHNEVVTYDAEGRLIYAYVDNRGYRRGLDNTVLEKFHTSGTPYIRRRFLNENEKRQLIETLRKRMETHILPELSGGSVKVFCDTSYDGDDVSKLVERVIETDYEKLVQDGKRFYEIYTPIGILPPDQYLALVVQVTHGCNWNKCIFCDFYERIKFRIKPEEELKNHIRAVLSFIGKALPLRRRVFLSDANALVIPETSALNVLDLLNEELRSYHPAFMGYYSFVDAFTGTRKSKEFWHEAKVKGLKRIYIGLETGNAELIEHLNKPGGPDEVFKLVSNAKSAGLSVGIIVMVGIGGDKYRYVHFRDTVKFIKNLPLGPEDIVYLSRFRIPERESYSEWQRERGVNPLAALEIENEMIRFRGALHGYPFRVTNYSIEEFIY